jgi:hypothetical protein
MAQQPPPTEPQDSLVAAILLVQEGMRTAKRVFEERIAPALATFFESMERLPGEVRPAIRALAARGWFISGEMGASELLAFAKVADDGDRLDSMMAGWIRVELPRILQHASERFPNREAILRSAFNAHGCSDFLLAVPAILIQVEGMCVEKLGSKLYAAPNGIPKTRAATEAFIDGAFSEVMFLPLRELHGLTAGERARAAWPYAPNRHEILHGIDLSYGNELTSLKAISLLEYFVTFVDRQERDVPGGGPPPNTSLERARER